MTMTSQFTDMTSSLNFSDIVLFLLSSLTLSGPVLPNIWRLEWVRDTKFGMDVSKKMLLNAAKCQGYSF